MWRPRSGATVFTSLALESRGMFRNTALRCCPLREPPTYFLHGTEAVHGSCGQLVPGDVVIAISNSGETAELKATVTAIRNNGCAVIAVTGGMNSWLASQAEVTLYAGVAQEGDPLNRAPRISILAEDMVLQRLSLLLQVYRNLDPVQYVKWHPGGALGQLRENEK